MTEAPSIDGETRLYVVIGDPIAQAQTPRLINPIFARKKSGIVAVPLHVSRERFDAAWSLLMATPNVVGLGVTMPHKITAAKRCDRLTTAAEAVGAVNIVRKNPDGSTIGGLFDGVGFVEGLGTHRARLRGASALLVGAGGAGRAIAHALAQEGLARLQIVDIDRRAAEDAAALVDRSAGRVLALAAQGEISEGQIAGFDVIINASPLGLKAGGALPFSVAAVKPGTVVVDIASLERETELLTQARAAECAVLDGQAMLTAQIELLSDFITDVAPRLGDTP